MICSKKGAAHVEIILSIVLFLVFVGAAWVIFGPVDSDQSIIENILDRSFDEVERRAQTEILTYSVKLNRDDIVGDVITIDLGRNFGNKQSRVEDVNGMKLSSEAIGGDLGKVNVAFGSSNFIYIMLSEDFPEGNVALGDPTVENYELSSYNSKKLLSVDGVEGLISSYESDYEGLKSQLRIPSQVDFSFGIVFSDGERSETAEEIPEDVEVFSKIKRQEILRAEGEREFVEFGVKIW
tara:strand:+ start:608 stop:1321 length:714 start_codon:yes stop_codon:yes gene_type:complete